MIDMILKESSDIMLYKIKDKYYILVENKYVNVDFSINNGNVEIVATKESIERENGVIAKSIVFDKEFKDSIKKEKERPKYFESKKSKELGNVLNKK